MTFKPHRICIIQFTPQQFNLNQTIAIPFPSNHIPKNHIISTNKQSVVAIFQIILETNFIRTFLITKKHKPNRQKKTNQNNSRNQLPPRKTTILNLLTFHSNKNRINYIKLTQSINYYQILKH